LDDRADCPGRAVAVIEQAKQDTSLDMKRLSAEAFLKRVHDLVAVESSEVVGEQSINGRHRKNPSGGIVQATGCRRQRDSPKGIRRFIHGRRQALLERDGVLIGEGAQAGPPNG